MTSAVGPISLRWGNDLSCWLGISLQPLQQIALTYSLERTNLMDQAPDSPTGLVTRLQGWLLPEIAENTRGSPGNIYGLQRIIGRKQTYAVSPGGKNSTSLLAESDIGPEDVLHFWFGGDMKVNYKTKWFPDGSSDTQKRADEVISKKFGELFCKAINGELSSWKRELRSTIALLLVYDQFSRHIYRLEEVTNKLLNVSNRVFAQHDGIILQNGYCLVHLDPTTICIQVGPWSRPETYVCGWPRAGNCWRVNEQKW